MKNKRLLLLIVILVAGFTAHAQIITTIAGGDTAGLGDGGPAIDCELTFPYNTTLDASGNLYIVDEGHDRIRKVSPAVGGIITTIAGNGSGGYSGDDSAATNAKLNLPWGIAVDGSGNVYFSDNYNHRVRKISAAGIITTVAGTGAYGYNGDGIPATAAELYSPHGIALDGSGNLYICDALNCRLRKVNLATGIITTIAGTGNFVSYKGDGVQATATDIGNPFGVAIDASGNVFFADEVFNRVFKINTSGIITTVAGTGTAGYNGDNIPATTAELRQPFNVSIDDYNNIFIADVDNNLIRKVDGEGIITTVAGTGVAGFSGDGGPATAAEINFTGVTVDAAGNIFIADQANWRIRYIKNTLSANTINNPIEALNIYPNPSYTGDLTVDIISGTDDNAQIIITDMMGRKVKEINTITNKPIEINLDVPNGIYFLSAITNNGKVTKELVIGR